MSRPKLRIVVVFVAALTGMKVWAQDRYHRTIYHEALMGAYEDRAKATCLKEFARAGTLKSVPRLSALEIVIGSPDVQVAIWDFDHPLWEVRYRHPHILLNGDTPAARRCAFDLASGLASLEGSSR